jgi:hypothetical protein
MKINKNQSKMSKASNNFFHGLFTMRVDCKHQQLLHKLEQCPITSKHNEVVYLYLYTRIYLLIKVKIAIELSYVLCSF